MSHRFELGEPGQDPSPGPLPPGQQSGIRQHCSLRAGSVMPPAVGRATRPWNSYLGFTQHHQMSSEDHSSSESAGSAVLENRIRLLFPNYEGGRLLRMWWASLCQVEGSRRVASPHFDGPVLCPRDPPEGVDVFSTFHTDAYKQPAGV